MAEDRRRVYVAIKGFATADRSRPAGALLLVREGDMCFEGDPLLKTHRDMFAPVDDMVEQTTAGPGERRFVRLPRRERGTGPARRNIPATKETSDAPRVAT